MSHSPARFAVETLSRDEIAQRIAQLQQVGATGQIELMRAVAAGTICLALPGRQHRISLEELAQTSRPLLMLIGDDDGAATGPAGWECAWLACRWARSAVIHGAGAKAAHYREAIEAATLTGRTLLIETSSERVDSWRRKLVGKPALIIVPRGGSHPVQPAAAEIH